VPLPVSLATLEQQRSAHPDSGIRRFPLWVHHRHQRPLRKAEVPIVISPSNRANGPNYRLTRKVDGGTVSETFASSAELLKAPRMHYPEFRRQGLFVGTGVIEAGCKTVIGARLKQSGMFWTVNGANSIIALRCNQLSGKFEDY
jgi:hypothetical protein